MKQLLTLLLVFLFFRSSAQLADSAAVAIVVDSLLQLATLEYDSYDHKEAILYCRQAENLAQEKFGKTSAAYASACFLHGKIADAQYDYEEAEKWLTESIDIREKIFGKNHPLYASSVFQLGVMFYWKSNYEQAEQLLSWVEKTQETILGKEDPKYAETLNRLGDVYDKLGDYPQAEQYYLRAKEIFAKTLGKESPNYLYAVENLAFIYRVKNDFAQAERMYLETQEVWVRKYGKEDEDYALNINNLGLMYATMGDYDKAISHLTESMAIMEKAFGKDHHDNIGRMGQLGDIYRLKGDMEKAESLLVEAEAQYAKAFGREDLGYTFLLYYLADLYFDKGAYDKAESLYLQLYTIEEKMVGEDHDHLAYTLTDLAKVYYKKRDYKKSEQLTLEAKQAFEKVFGKDHADNTSPLFNLATLYQKTNRIAEAKAAQLELNRLSRLNAEYTATFASESQMLHYLDANDVERNFLLSFNHAHPSPEVNRACYDNTLFYNGLVLENSRLLSRSIAGADSLTLEIYEKWLSCHHRLAKRYARPIAERKKIAEVEEEAEGYEKKLMSQLPAFRQTRQTPRWQDVSKRLKPDEAAIEFIQYAFYDPDETDSTMYAALLLRPGWEAPQMVPLFEKAQLDSILGFKSERKAAYVAQLYSIEDRGITPVEAMTKTLYELLWKPLEKHLSGAHTVYFAPSGLLHRLNLSAIPSHPDSTLADRYRLIEVGSTRQLAQAQARAFSGKQAILFGGIQYEMDSVAIFAANESLKNEADIASRGAENIQDDDFSSRGERWNYLRWTDKEIGAVSAQMFAAGFEPSTRKGFEATEEAFKSIGKNGPSPHVLHLATHGFFFPDPKALNKNPAEYERETGFKTSHNPMVRSGLLLAGANHAWTTGKPFKKNMENGILTAYEISRMDLSNTELVVLSACETGLGDIEGNEGVYGLQRAFKIAGAKYLMMSLWQVPDQETYVFMTAFYKHWLEEGKSIPDAFHISQQEMRERFVNPYQWAGFVLVE